MKNLQKKGKYFFFVYSSSLFIFLKIFYLFFLYFSEVIYKFLYNIISNNRRINSRLVKNVSITRIKRIFELTSETNIYISSIIDINLNINLYRRKELHNLSTIQSIQNTTNIINLIKKSLKLLNYTNIDIKIIKFEENLFEGRNIFTCYYSIIKNKVLVRNIDIQRITRQTLVNVSTELNILSIREEKITFVESEKIIRKKETLSIYIKNEVSQLDFSKFEFIIKKSIEETNNLNVNIKIIATEEYINEIR